MISPFPFMSISSFCAKVGAGPGNSVISGGDWQEGRRKVLIGHLKRALYKKVPTAALIQNEDPEMDAILFDYAQNVCNTSIRIVNGTSKNYCFFDQWKPYMFGAFAARIIPGGVEGFAAAAFRSAQETGAALQSLRASIGGLRNCPPNISVALHNLAMDIEAAFLPRSADPDDRSFSVGGEQDNPTLCVIHLDAFRPTGSIRNDTSLAYAYFAQELLETQQKLWVAELKDVTKMDDMLTNRISNGMLGICSRAATAQMYQLKARLANQIDGVSDINSAAILFDKHVSPSQPDLRLLNSPGNGMHIGTSDIGLLTKVVYYHGRRSLLNGGQPMIRPSVFLD